MDQLVCVLWIIFLICNIHLKGVQANIEGNPDEVIVERVTNESITLRWTSTGADQYKVLWSDTGSGPQKESYIIGTTFTIDNLLSGNLYLIFVKACDAERICNDSATATSALTEPNKPQNLKFDIDKSNVLRVSWTTGVSVLDVFQTVTVLSNDTIVDNVETDYDTYINENLNANTLNTIEIFSSIKNYPNTTTSKSQHQLWTYPVPVELSFYDLPMIGMLFLWSLGPSSVTHHELIIFDEDEDKCIRKVQSVEEPGVPTLPSCDTKCEIGTLNITGNRYNETEVQSCGHYSGTLYAINAAGCSNATKHYFTKVQHEAMLPMNNTVSFNDITENSMNLSWSNVHPGYERCEKTYNVSFYSHDCASQQYLTSTINNIRNNHLYVGGLEPYTNYTFCIEVHFSLQPRQTIQALCEPSFLQITNQAVPGKPENFTYDSSNGYLAWELPECEIHGILQYHSLNYSCFEPDRPNIIKEASQIQTMLTSWKVKFKPFRTCQVSIAGFTIGLGEMAKKTLHTSENVPGMVVLSVGETTDSSILLLWQEPKERNGIILNYTVQWQEYGQSENNYDVLDAANFTYIVTCLDPSTNYNISVFASTSAGFGERNTISVMTNIGFPGKVEDITFDEQNGNLSWVLPGCQGNGKLQFYSVYCSCHEVDQPSIIKENYQINTTVNFLEVKFKPFRTCKVSIAGYTVGFGEEAEKTFNTSESAPGKVVLSANDTTQTSILLIWQEPEERNGIIVNYTVQWQEFSKPDDNYQVLNATDFTYNITGLSPFTNYIITVFASTSVGSGEFDPIFISTKMAFPGKVENITFDESNGNLTWTLQPHRVNGILQYYTVNYTCYEVDQPNIIREEEQSNTAVNFLKVKFKPFRTCKVSIAGFTIGFGEVAEETFNTSESVPEEVALSVNDTTDSSILLIWQEPEERNGIIVNYTVQWNEYGRPDDNYHVLNATDFTYNITGLSPYTNYSITVFASTSVGSGEFDSFLVSTMMGLPGEVKNITYENGTLAWDLQENNVNGILEYYAIKFSCHEPDRPSVIKEEEQFNTTYNFLEVKFKPFRSCIVGIAGYTVGFGEVAEETFNTSESEPGKVALSVDDKTFTSILLAWKEPKERNGFITNYTISWRRDFNEYLEVLNSTDYNYVITRLTPATAYIFTVFASTGAGTGEPETLTVTTWTGRAYMVASFDVSVDETNPFEVMVSWLKDEITGPTNYMVCVSEEENRDACFFKKTIPADKSELQNTSLIVRYGYWDYTAEIRTIVEQWDGTTNTAVSSTQDTRTGKTNPGTVPDFQVVLPGNIDCQLVSLSWIALDQKYHNGIFKNYTITAMSDAQSTVVSMESEYDTSTEIFLKGGKHYEITIFAVNDLYEGIASMIQYENPACAPIIKDSGATLIEQSTDKAQDRQRGFVITYDESFFRNDNFGLVEKLGFLIRDVTVSFLPRNKSTLMKTEFEAKFQSKWIDYEEDKAESYRIDLPAANAISMENNLLDYTLGADGKCGGFCNGYLKPGSPYKIQMFSCTSGGCLITSDALFTIETEESTQTTFPLIAVVATLAVLLVISILIHVVSIHRLKKMVNMKRKTEEMSTENTYDYIAEDAENIRKSRRRPQPPTIGLNTLGTNSRESDQTATRNNNLEIKQDDVNYYNVKRNGTENIEDNSETGTGPYEPLRKDSKQTMQTVEQISMWDYKNSLQMHFDS